MSYAYVFFLTPLAILISWWIRQKWCLPIFTAISVYFPFLWEIQKSVLNAYTLLIFWALWQSILIVFLSCRNAIATEDFIWYGKDYAEKMFLWIDSGVLPEGSSRFVLVSHLRNVLVYSALALISINFLSLVLGSALLNYMNYYVGQLLARSKNRFKALLMGWNTWSIVRVLSFLWLGVVLSLPILERFVQLNFPFSPLMLVPALAGILADLVLKISTARIWSVKLKQNLQQTFIG